MSVAYVNFWAGTRDGVPYGFISNEKIDFTAGEADVTIPGSAGGAPVLAEIAVDAACHWLEGAIDTNATTAARYLGANERQLYWVSPARDLSVIAHS
jgi:hypothetical protein